MTFSSVQPTLTFTVADTQYMLTFIGLLLVGIIISNLAALLRDQVDALQQRNRQTQAINRFSRELTGAVGLKRVFEALSAMSARLFPGMWSSFSRQKNCW